MRILRAALERAGAHDWEVGLEDLWCSARPERYTMPRQGWKLHLAASRASAAAVLERALPALIEERCAFKFASTLEGAALLNSASYPLGESGKFLTAYPLRVAHFRRVASEFDRATEGLVGPAILSDRRNRPGSIVHYRYGAFAGRTRLGNDGEYVARIRTPAGRWIEDRCEPRFTPPPGVRLPFREPHSPPLGVDPARGSAPLLMGRFRVGEVLRQANRGGVYRATDTWIGDEVVLKEARPHVEARADGWDVQQALRHEARMLDRLAPLGIAPRKRELFEEEGHLFLAEELLPGRTLEDWVADRAGARPGLGAPLALAILRRLARLVGRAHEGGIALRDLAPANVMVGGDDAPRLVDFELAASLGARAVAGGTRGYAAPEQLEGAPPSAAGDLFGLGALAFLVATARSAAFADDRPPSRSPSRRLEDWLDLVAPHSEAARRLGPLILGLTREAPEERWELARVESFLASRSSQLSEPCPPLPPFRSLQPLESQPGTSDAPAHAARAEKEPDGEGPRLDARDPDRLIEDGLGHLLATMDPDAPRLWPTSAWGRSSDPACVQHGAAGVIAVLARALGARGDERLRAGLRIACTWLEAALPREPRLLPGLCSGRAGTAWALHDAARLLNDEAMAERALALARRLPLRWPNPGLAHGAAGAGLAQLHFWQATGDPTFRRRALRCAEAHVACAERVGDRVRWSVPAGFDSKLAGRSDDGLAHGLAGIAWFLLAAGRALGREDWIGLARRAGETLVEAARRGGEACWRPGPAEELGRPTHGRDGASGVASFLVRVWQETGWEEPRALAEEVALAVRRSRWHAAPEHFAGLTGDGELLLDLAQATSEPRYRAWAEELAALIRAQSAQRAGRLVTASGFDGEVAADYGGGLAGVLAFLLRLRHGGERMWLPDGAQLFGFDVEPQPEAVRLRRPATGAGSA